MNNPKLYPWLYLVILISCTILSCSKQDSKLVSLGSVFPLTAGYGDTFNYRKKFSTERCNGRDKTQ
jgi:hypothetical protein